MITIKIISILLAASCLCSCRYVKISKETKQELAEINSGAATVSNTILLPKFCNIDMSIAAEVNLEQSDASYIKITAPKNYIDYIIAYVDGNTLNVSSKKKSFILGMKDVKIEICSPELEDLIFSGAVELSSNDLIVSENFSLSCNGASEVEMEYLTAGKVNIEVNGASDIEIEKLESPSLKLVINGAGDCKLSGNVGYADITLNGAGDVDVSGLKVDAMGSCINGTGKITRPL